MDAAELAIADGCAKGPVCGCLAQLRIQLRPLNGKPGLSRETDGAFVFVRRIDPLPLPPPFVTAAFCPFCGEAYQ